MRHPGVLDWYWFHTIYVQEQFDLEQPLQRIAPVGQWSHVVVTVDAATNISLYVNGSQAGATKAAFSLYAPDYWSPFQVGNGRGTTRAVQGIVDEVAIYTNALPGSNIYNHYAAGTNVNPSTPYFQLVTNDTPVIYFRMDGPAYAAPNVSTWPVLMNYGSAGANGVYAPGTMPGIVAGPVTSSGAPFSGLSGAKVAQFSGVSSFADAGYAAEYNPVGAKPFTLIAMFRGDPADGRTQTIVGHSDNSWRLWLNTSGKLQCAARNEFGQYLDLGRSLQRWPVASSGGGLFAGLGSDRYRNQCPHC